MRGRANDFARGLSLSRVSELLRPDPETGKLFWKVARKGGCKVGDEAGTLHRFGYIQICIDQRLYKSHRILWLLMTGEWPKEIDHINGNKSDNRICNLREATRKQNCANIGIRRNNTSGIKGVRYRPDRKKWVARMSKNKRTVHLGYFDSPEAASTAYRNASIEAHGEFARTE